MDAILDFHKKNLVDTPAPTHVKSWLRPCTYFYFILFSLILCQIWKKLKLVKHVIILPTMVLYKTNLFEIFFFSKIHLNLSNRVVNWKDPFTIGMILPFLTRKIRNFCYFDNRGSYKVNILIINEPHS